jgi:hypothetical protein
MNQYPRIEAIMQENQRVRDGVRAQGNPKFDDLIKEWDQEEKAFREEMRNSPILAGMLEKELAYSQRLVESMKRLQARADDAASENLELKSGFAEGN